MTRSFCPLPSWTRDLPALEIEILHPETTALQQTQPRAVQQQRHEPGNTPHALDDGGDLRRREDEGHALRTLRPREVAHLLQRDVHHAVKQEQQRRERLVLRGRAHALLVGQVREKGLDLRPAQLADRTVAMELDEPLDPVTVRLGRARAVMTRTDDLVDALQQGGAGHGGAG